MTTDSGVMQFTNRLGRSRGPQRLA